MFATLFTNLEEWQVLIVNPLWLLLTAFQIWMLVHAIRNREWLWAVFLLIGWSITAILYFFLVYRNAGSSSTSSGFELPGAQNRRRIRELKAQIDLLDNAYHHFQLGDVYFQRGQFAEAEKCYRAALEREPADIDARAHLGQCLLRLKRPAEARPLLEGVMHEKPDHDYGYTMMALAEALTALGEKDKALLYWEHIVQHHSYPRAKVQLAELYLEKPEAEKARAQLNDVVKDDQHAPIFQRRRDRVWVQRARNLLHQVK